MYSNKKVTNDFPMKRLVPFFESENSTRRYSYTDGMTLNNEGRRSNSSIPSPVQIQKLQKKLLQMLETNYEMNKKYGNILPNNTDRSSPKPYPTAAEQKRSAAIYLLRKRTNNALNNAGDFNNVNGYRKGSVDDYLLTHHHTINDKVEKRQQALSVLMRRVSNVNTKKNDNSQNIRKYSYDSIQPNLPTINTSFNKGHPSPSINTSFNNGHPSPSINTNFNTMNFKPMDSMPSPNPYNKNYENSPYYHSFLNYDMINSPNAASGMPNVFRTTMESSPSLNALKAYDMNGSNNISNILSPISPSPNFMNSKASTARKSVNIGSMANNSKLFENNRLLQLDLSMMDMNSCPASPIGTSAPSNNGLFMTNRYPSTEELSQKIAENQIMIDYLSKLCISNGNGDLNEQDSVLFANNNKYTTSKLPPAPAFFNNDLNDYTMQSPSYTPNTTNHSPPPPNDLSPPFIGRSGSSKKYSLNDSAVSINNFPSPYVNTNKVISSNLPMPSSPYLGNAKVNIASGRNDLTSPKFNATPSNSPYLGMAKSQEFKRNPTPPSYVNNFMGRGLPSPSPSFSNISSNSNGNNNGRFAMNTNNTVAASPSLYSVSTISMNDLGANPGLFNDNISLDLSSKFNSKSMPSSPNIGYNESNLYSNTKGGNNNNNNNVSVPSVMDQRTLFTNNKLNSMLPTMYNSNGVVQKSQSILPAYTSTTNTSTTQTPSPNIGAIGRPSTVTKIQDLEESKVMNPLASLAFEKQKSSSPLLNENSFNQEFSQLSISSASASTSALATTSASMKSTNTSTLLSNGIPSSNTSTLHQCHEISMMDPKPKVDQGTNLLPSSSISPLDLSFCSNSNSSFVEESSFDKPYQLFDTTNDYDFLGKTELTPISKSFESFGGGQRQNPIRSLEDSPLVRSVEDKNCSPYHLDMPITSDSFSNNSNTNNMFSLSMQHPVLS